MQKSCSGLPISAPETDKFQTILETWTPIGLSPIFLSLRQKRRLKFVPGKVGRGKKQSYKPRSIEDVWQFRWGRQNPGFWSILCDMFLPIFPGPGLSRHGPIRCILFWHSGTTTMGHTRYRKRVRAGATCKCYVTTFESFGLERTDGDWVWLTSFTVLWASSERMQPGTKWEPGNDKPILPPSILIELANLTM